MTKRTFKCRYGFIAVFVLVLGLLLSLTGCAANTGFGTAANPAPSSGSQSTGTDSGVTSRLRVHFIDVGQGDSILVESAGHFMLIDAGENDQGQTVVSYLEEAGVAKLDCVIGTHPHSDHIGGLDDVIHTFDLDQVILPPVEHTTKTFEDVLDAIADKGLKITKPVPGTSYTLGEAEFTILSPVKDYGDDLNNWSVGIRLTCGDTSFVMCGDAEAPAEKDIIDSKATLSADVLKAGHHGSSTSTSKAFLKAVSPTWAVIQCGKDNSYGHPHRETMEAFQEAGVTVLRNDELGTIIASSDGTDISWYCGSGTEALEALKADLPSAVTENGLSPDSDSAAESTYILNTNTKKFHLPECSSVKQIQEGNKKEFHGTRNELTEQGYSPCGQCKP